MGSKPIIGWCFIKKHHALIFSTFFFRAPFFLFVCFGHIPAPIPSLVHCILIVPTCSEFLTSYSSCIIILLKVWLIVCFLAFL